uniref:Uncharacterized protein n=1 Tax=Arundo donax TaxID=35708 RepID=A0A0A9AD47_ARUDO
MNKHCETEGVCIYALFDNQTQSFPFTTSVLLIKQLSTCLFSEK